MACYECGLEDTSDGKLCPECTRKRLEGKRQVNEAAKVEENLQEASWWLSLIHQYPQEAKLIYGILCVLAVALIIRFLPKEEKIYVSSPSATAPRVVAYCKEHLDPSFISSLGNTSSDAKKILELFAAINSKAASTGDKKIESLKASLTSEIDSFCQKYGDACLADSAQKSCQDLLKLVPEKR